MNAIINQRLKNLILFVILQTSFVLYANAQCTCEAVLINLETANDCDSTLTNANFPFSVCTIDSFKIFGPGPVEITPPTLDMSHVGMAITYRLYGDNLGPAGMCTGNITVGVAPLVVNFPQKDTLYCNTPIDSFPELTADSIDYCLPVTVELSPGAGYIGSPGCPTGGGIIFAQYARRWFIREGGNIIGMFDDTICLRTIPLAAIEFPPSLKTDTFLLCENPDTAIAQTGLPTVNGIPVQNSLFCNLWIWTSTEVIDNPLCPNNFVVKRSWTIMDNCTMNSIDSSQSIEVKDTSSPVITVPDTLRVSTKITDCTADVTFPAPTSLTDNCTDSADIEITILRIAMPGGAILDFTTDGTMNDIPEGINYIVYEAKEPCNPPGRDTMILIVEDLIAPVPQCGDPKEFQFNGAFNEVILTADKFDNGSYDGCGGPVFFKVKRMDPQVGCETPGNPLNKFHDEIKFCCEDVPNSPVMVLLRVYDVFPGIGPISDDTLAGRYVQCMVPVTILDKEPPVITCLPDTITCDEIFDLSNVPVPIATDNCGDPRVSLDTIIYDLDDCKTGFIYRKYRAEDAVGQVDSCTQVIVVQIDSLFDGDNPNHLIWPADTTLFGCAASTDTSITGSPKILYNGCSLIAMKYEDDLYQYVDGVCYKILRFWKVLDWCQFDGDQYNPYRANSGFWHHTQVIKVMDSIPPVIDPNTVRDYVVNSAANECDSAQVDITPILATDCTNNIKYSYFIDEDNNGSFDKQGVGNDPSGQYPYGEHLVKVVAEDRCGQFADTTFLVVVRDGKPPTVRLMAGLITELMDMGGGNGMVPVYARLFNKDSEDNCTAREDLRFAFSNNPDDTVKIYNCPDTGINMVTIYVFDEIGNFDLAITTVDVQDNQNVCGNNPVFVKTQVFGKVSTSYGKAVDKTKITIIDQSHANPVITDLHGTYKIDNVPINNSYKLVPTKQDDPLNGISTLDIVLITKHILGIQPLDSPYKLLAADVNLSNHISTLDIVALRKAVLGIDEKINEEKSWRFVDAKYHFVNPQNPFLENVPETYHIYDLQGKMNVDFVGIKLGDVNHSVVTGQQLLTLESRSLRKEAIYIPQRVLQTNEEYTFKLQMMPSELWGMQFAMKVDDKLADLIDVQPIGVINKNHYSRRDQEFRVSFNSEEPIAANHLIPVVEVTLKAKKPGRLLDLIQLSESLTAESYSNFGIHDIVLQEENGTGWAPLTVLQNTPNPFQASTTISYQLVKSTDLVFSIYDLAGKQLHSQDVNGAQGTHQVIVNNPQLPGPGIYIYEFKSSHQVVRKKMMHIH